MGVPLTHHTIGSQSTDPKGNADAGATARSRRLSYEPAAQLNEEWNNVMRKVSGIAICFQTSFYSKSRETNQTFTRWINAHLLASGLNLGTIVPGLCDGVLLANLIQVRAIVKLSYAHYLICFRAFRCTLRKLAHV